MSKIAGCNLLLISTERYIKDEEIKYVVNSMYTKSEITEISMEVDQCMCCAAMAPIIGISNPIASA